VSIDLSSVEKFFGVPCGPLGRAALLKPMGEGKDWDTARYVFRREWIDPGNNPSIAEDNERDDNTGLPT
jgi:hypothetical protein